MKLTGIFSLVFLILPMSLYGVQSYYCPQNHQYINVGMSADQVVSACGEPLSRQNANNPVTVRVPVQQLIYNNQGAEQPFAAQTNYWAPLKTGNGGVQLEVNIVDYRVKLIRINGSNSNAASVCQGINIQIGDSVAKVYNACGAPSVVNNSYINQVTTPATPPQLWIYQAGDYQAPFSLIFVDGRLHSIDLPNSN
ncbi:MAG: DUF2845 domain-containing protein [Legionella sp.]|nr:DUF2845 domain-containing protein [Legionella sp.]